MNYKIRYFDGVPVVMAKLTVDEMVQMFYGDRKSKAEVAKTAGISVEYFDEIRQSKVWTKHHMRFDRKMGFPTSY